MAAAACSPASPALHRPPRRLRSSRLDACRTLQRQLPVPLLFGVDLRLAPRANLPGAAEPPRGSSSSSTPSPASTLLQDGIDLSRAQETAGEAAARREAGLKDYQELKEELTRLNANITAFGTAYCFLGHSLETALSFAFGCAFSVAYLHALFKAADDTSPESVPAVFRGRLPRNRTTRFVDSLALVASPGRVLEGMKLSLASRRLVIPAIMMLAYSASAAAAAGDHSFPHLELAAMLLGFLSYKASVLVVTFRGQLDLLQ